MLPMTRLWHIGMAHIAYKGWLLEQQAEYNRSRDGELLTTKWGDAWWDDNRPCTAAAAPTFVVQNLSVSSCFLLCLVFLRPVASGISVGNSNHTWRSVKFTVNVKGCGLTYDNGRACYYFRPPDDDCIQSLSFAVNSKLKQWLFKISQICQSWLEKRLNNFEFYSSSTALLRKYNWSPRRWVEL